MGGSFSARVPRSSAEVRWYLSTRYLSTTLWKLRVSDSRNSRVIRGDDEEGEEVNGEVEQIRNSTHNELTHARAMWDECELEPCRHLSQCSVIEHLNKEQTVKGR